MNDNLKQTKRKLTIIFSLIVFSLVLFLGFIFFTSKYYKEVQFENSDFNNFVSFIEDDSFDIDNFVIGFNQIKKNRFGKGVEIGLPILEIEQENTKKGFKPQNFINFIMIDNNKKIVASDIKDEITNDIITDTLANNKYLEITQNKEFLIKKIYIDDTKNTLILFKKLRYGFNDYLEDLLGFIAINLLFSILLYIVGYGFVDKTLKPIEANIKDMKDFIHNVGHELKTPISVIDSNIQLINDLKTYDKEMTMELKKEVIRLNSLIDSLINLTNIDLRKISSDVNLRDILEEIINDFKAKITEKNLDIKITVAKSIAVKTNKDYFYMFLANLIGNSIKYNKQDGKIDITYKSGELVIHDTGVGIDKADLPHIFDRFYKADKSRNTEGFGIGLSLVKKISDIYKWKIAYEGEDGEGTKVRIKLG